MAVSLSSRINTAIAKRISSYVRKYDQNWFVRFINEARREDVEAGIGVQDSLRQHAWVNIAVFFLARNVTRANFQILRGEDEITSGPAYKLFQFVNKQMSKYQLWEATEAWRKVKGEAFWIFDMFVQDKTGFPQTIHVINPNSMTHRIDENGEITMWQFEQGQTKIPFLPSELIHFKDWNAWDYYRGVNPLIAQSYELAQDFSANQNNLSILRNGSVPGGVLSNKKTGQNISKEQAEEIKERWEQKHRGPNHVAEVTVLGNGLEYQQIQQSIEDMQFFNLKKWNRQTILSRYGVPGVLVGVTDERAPLSGSDTQSQMQNVWNHTLIPDLEFYEDKLETDFFARFRLNDLKPHFDLSEIAELAEDQAELSTKAQAEIGKGMITINEWREEQDLDPVPWGNTWWVPLGSQPAEFAMEPPEPVPPQLAAPPDNTDEERTISVEAILKQEPKALPEGIKASPAYNEVWRTMQWKALVGDWEKLEGQYTRALRDWFFKQRSYLLQNLSGKNAADAIVKELGPQSIAQWTDFAYWLEQEAELKTISKPLFTAAAVATGKRLIRQFIDLEIVFDANNWNILNTGAVRRIDTRLTKIGGIVKTVREHVGGVIEDSLKGGWTVAETAEKLKEIYGFANNRAKTIARTELGGVISDSQIEGFVDVGVTEVMWSSSRDRKVRFTHVECEGVTVKIGENFPNGLMWPREVGAPAEEVVNCRCTLIPMKPEGDE